jgi:hypothetical protein
MCRQSASVCLIKSPSRQHRALSGLPQLATFADPAPPAWEASPVRERAAHRLLGRAQRRKVLRDDRPVGLGPVVKVDLGFR